MTDETNDISIVPRLIVSDADEAISIYETVFGVLRITVPDPDVVAKALVSNGGEIIIPIEEKISLVTSGYPRDHFRTDHKYLNNRQSICRQTPYNRKYRHRRPKPAISVFSSTLMMKAGNLGFKYEKVT